MKQETINEFKDYLNEHKTFNRDSHPMRSMVYCDIYMFFKKLEDKDICDSLTEAGY